MARTDETPDEAPAPASTPASADPADGTSGAVVRPGELGAVVGELAESELEPDRRRRLLGRFVEAARRRGVGALYRPRTAMRWVVDAVADIAPYVPVRDLETLRRHHDGLGGEELAERLIRNAARATAGVGATGGGIAAVEWVATPTLLTAPVLLAAETVAVVAIELKLIGELHEVYGVPVRGSVGARSVALMQAWTDQRGVNPFVPGGGAAAVLGTAARKELRERLLRRFGRNLTTLGPLLTGAAVAGYLNRRATRSLGDHLREDLRKRARAIGPA